MSLHAALAKTVTEYPRLRPPGTVADALFHERCTACGDCAAVCPTQIIRFDAEGYPELDPLAVACTDCGLCADVCMHGAIEPE